MFANLVTQIAADTVLPEVITGTMLQGVLSEIVDFFLLFFLLLLHSSASERVSLSLSVCFARHNE